MPPKESSSTKKCANPRMETPVINFVMHTCSGAPINQCMTLIFVFESFRLRHYHPPKKSNLPPLPRGNLFMSFNDYSAILARHAKSSVATTEPRTDTESDTQDHPKTDDLVTDDEDNSEGQADAHEGDPKIHESLPPSDTPEDENSSLDGAPSSENNYPYRNQEARRQAEHCAMLAQRDPSSSEEESDEDDDEYKEDQEADEEKEEADDNDDNDLPAPPSKTKLPQKCAPPKALPPKSTVTGTPPSTQVLQAAAHVTMKSVEKSPISSALPKSSMAMETDDDDNDPPVTSRPGRLCQEGIDDTQELGRKTLHAAKLIGDKYGKSARTILIEARLSVKHSRAETPWNMHQGWYKGKYPRETDEELSDWRKRQRDHYYNLEDSDPLWDDIQAHYDGHLGSASNNRSRASIVMSTRDALAKHVTYSHLEGIEVIGCVFDSTPDEVARQALGFVAGSSTFMDVINERQVDAQLALDWIITAANLVKPHGTVTDWRKLLDVAYQNKFQFELWPDKVPPVGPDFNYHTLSAQHLKLLVVPYIKRRALQYYDTELKTEAENLLELRCKQGRSKKTLDDIIDELDVAVSEIDIVPWPKDHIEQCEKDDPKMFDIPLVTSASNIVLRKLADSEKFKHSIPQGLLQKYKEATSVCGSNVGVPSGGRQLGDTTRDRQSQQQTSAAREYSIVRENHYTDDADEQLASEADSLNASDSRITKKSKLIFRSYVIVMVRHMLNCHLCTLSLLILDPNFNLDLALALTFVHLHLTTNHINTGMMRYSRCLRIIFIPMGIMLPIIIAMIFWLQALQEWLQGHVRDPIMTGTLRLLGMIHMIVISFTVTNVSYHSNYCAIMAIPLNKLRIMNYPTYIYIGLLGHTKDQLMPSVYVICGGPSQGSYWAGPYIYCPLNIEQATRTGGLGDLVRGTGVVMG
ncbi:uncharacterized protein F5891DRAFT_987757 [Suillus fuscotomentosus]|uniref:Uncharacterized protein n=1 Tax=Suillus fuscotomentosus TaxID=1912939 RepID=A0AAD4DPP9_9AGAM|nr:uncharacterized protein F5891DRAFT_987757 [Suillus fuscotomentosus]KAG1888874.1 hypothetical protein F5891DRAFT_987757 [Suillus fuscotomentosus]